MPPTLYFAGGIPQVMKAIRPFLHTEVLTVTGKTLGENLDGFMNRVSRQPRSLSGPLHNPHSTLGGLAILRGNLAPDTAVAKPAAIHPDVRVFSGEAVCFDSEDDCVKAIEARLVRAGHVVVIRYEGPKGGPRYAGALQADEAPHGTGLGTFSRHHHGRPVFRHQQRLLCRPYLPRGRGGRTAGPRQGRRYHHNRCLGQER